MFLGQHIPGINSHFTLFSARCFSFAVPKEFQDEMVSDVVVNLKQEATIYLNHPGQFLLNGFRRNMVQAKSGTAQNIDVRHQVSE